MVEVISVLTSDYEELASFLASFPGLEGDREMWLSRFRWWWDENPVFREELLRGWALRADGRIVGFMGAIPLHFLLNGKEDIVFGGTTWRVLKEFRGQSFALKRRQMDTRTNALQFSTTPKPSVAAMLKMLGSREIAKWQNEFHQSIVITDPGTFLLRKLGRSALGKIFAKAATPAAFLYQAFQLRKRRPHSSVTAREVHRADQSFDDLWRRTRGVYKNTNVRGSRELNWYCQSDLGGRKVLLGCYAGESLQGFMLLLEESDSDVKILRCIDLWLDPSSDTVGAVGALVRKAARIARDRHFERVVLPHFNSTVAALYRELHLLTRPAWERREFLSGPAELLDSMTVENTYLVGAQGDVGL